MKFDPEEIEAQSGDNSAESAALVHLGDGLSVAGFKIALNRNAEIFGEEEPADFLYKVLSGVVRTIRLISDGRRQIGAFYHAGDVFGLEHSRAHRFSAEAVVRCELAMVARAPIARLVAHDSAAAQQVALLTARQLDDIQDHLLLLGHKTATERVGGFLLKLARRHGSNAFALTMPRCDIADYLGVSLETVSRTLNHLAREEIISLTRARQVVLRDPASLASICAVAEMHNSIPEPFALYHLNTR
ncbi:MAG TPA: helix-turn-helix domain-containing protein [Caulobacteraceae bacterium]|nr:helix-turn-helix domain-containing protein [Caulobacteraceae bacterium]